MSRSQAELPVTVLSDPHWRVNFRPDEYEEELIPSLKQCFEIIEKNKLSLRGWDYPHLSNRDEERTQGNNWVASWSDFWNHREYWRLYQSGQFLHLFSVGEETQPEWRQELLSAMKGQLSYRDDIEWDQVPGFISILNFTYSMTEIFEFAARLCQAQIYRGVLNIGVSIRGIKGFVLAAGWERSWRNFYATAEDELSRSWSFETDALVAESSEKALNAIHWFLERFGWLSPNLEVIRSDQENFLRGRI